MWQTDGIALFDPDLAKHPDNAGRNLYVAREYPPYKPQFEERYAGIIASNRAGKPGNDRTASCLPPGLPRIMFIGQYPRGSSSSPSG